MTSLAIILVIASALLHVARDFLTKSSKDKQIFIWWTTVISLVYMLPVMAYSWAKYGTGEVKGLWIALGISVVHFLYWISYTKAYDGGDLSQVYPIIRSSPALVLVFAVLFLNEKVSALGVAGILLITLGVCFINFGGVKNSDSKHIKFAFFALICTTIYTLVDKIGIGYVDPVTYSFLVAASASILFGIYIFKVKNRSEIAKIWQNNRGKLLLNGFIAAACYPLLLAALAMSKVSYVAGLKQIGVVLAVVVGGSLLKEKNMVLRLCCAALIVGGAVFISMAK
ncbi:MAG: DMT family transporter [Patescibacteria group bacterium]